MDIEVVNEYMDTRVRYIMMTSRCGNVDLAR